MKIVFFGTPQFAVPTLQRLLAHQEFDVAAVVTQPDKRRGRGKQTTPTAVKQVALANGLPVWQPQRIKKDAETITKLKAGADAFVVVAYGQILSSEILEIPALGCINVHGSILPQYRGAAPIQWSLYNGDSQTGITTMQMDRGMDTGPMLLKATTPVGLLENAHQLAVRLAETGADLLVETLLKLKRQEVEPVPQDDSQATYAPLIQKTDYGLDWSRSALELHNQIRGFFPNCVATFRGQPLKVLSSAPLGKEYWSQLPPELRQPEEVFDAHPGAVVKTIKNIGFVVQTGSGTLLLREVQPSGKRPQSGWDFANGARLSSGERLS